jgi:hypothetical protein
MESSSRQTDLATLNSISARAAEAEFLKCCGSQNWATQMAGARPWDTVNEMIAAADRIWWKLGRQDWLDAFHSHPRETAYEWVQRNAMQVWDRNENFKELLKKDTDIKLHLSPEEIDGAFMFDTYLRNVNAIFDRVFD